MKLALWKDTRVVLTTVDKLARILAARKAMKMGR